MQAKNNSTKLEAYGHLRTWDGEGVVTLLHHAMAENVSVVKTHSNHSKNKNVYEIAILKLRMIYDLDRQPSIIGRKV